MTVLVTGGAGYIGSHVVMALVDRGDQVVVFDSLSTGRRSAVPDPVPLVEGDIRDVELLEETIHAHAVGDVIHLAAQKSVPASMLAPGPTFSTNVSGTLAVLEAMTTGGVDRLVFSSSCAVYGVPDHLPIHEGSPIRPENPYGESKAQSERLIEWFERPSDLRSVRLRYFNAAGAHPGGQLGEPWQQAENLIPVVLRAAFTGEPVVVFGTDYETPDGTAVRDFVHVVDLAEAHLLALDHLAAGGDGLVLNVGTGAGASVLQVIETARRVLDRPIRVVHAPRRAGDPPAVWADSQRAASDIGWTANHDLESMIADAWRWHTGRGQMGT